MQFETYLELARQLEGLAAASGLKIVIRPHSIEQRAIALKYGNKDGAICIERRGDFYEALSKANTVISELSTGLFEAVGVTNNIYLWETPKSKFSYPTHPFIGFSNASDISDIRKNASPTFLAPQADLFWAPDWHDNFQRFLSTVGAVREGSVQH